MDATLTLGTRNFALTSVAGTSSTRAAKEATPDLPNTLEISHSTSKGGVRRSMVKLTNTKKNALGVTKSLSFYAVLSRDVAFFDETDIDAVLTQLNAFLSSETLTDAFNNAEV